MALALLGALAMSCGSSSKPDAARGDADTSPDALPDAATDAPAHADAARADTTASVDAHVAPVDAGPDDARLEVGNAPDGVSGGCGAFLGAACPATYLGTAGIFNLARGGFTAAMAPDATLYWGGGFSSATDFDPSPSMDVRTASGFADGFITKVGAAGNYLSTSTFPGTTNGRFGVEVTALAAVASGVVALGDFDDAVDLDPGLGRDVHQVVDPATSASFVVKLTAAGAFAWGRTLDASPNGDSAYWSQLAAAADGTTYLTGGYTGSPDVDPGPAKHLAPAATNGAFLMRLEANGAFGWVRTLGGDACDSLQVGPVVLGADGAPWFVGTYSGRCSFDQAGLSTVPADAGMFVASLGTDGKVRSLGSVVGNMSVTALAAASDGSITVGGWAGPATGQTGPLDFDPSPAVAPTAVPDGADFVLSLTAAGGLRWVRFLPAEISVTALGATADGGVLVGGTSQGAPRGMVILRLAADGREAWRLYAGNSSTAPTTVLVSAKGFVVAGTQSSTGDLDPTAGVDRFAGSVSFVSRYAF